MSDQLKRITRKVCEELGIECGLKDPKAVMQNPRLRERAHMMIDRVLREENEPKMPEEKVLEITPEGKVIDTDPDPEKENGGPPVIEMELEPQEEEKSGS